MLNKYLIADAFLLPNVFQEPPQSTSEFHKDSKLVLWDYDLNNGTTLCGMFDNDVFLSSSSSQRVLTPNESSDLFKKKYEKLFYTSIKNTIFEDGEENPVTLLFHDMLRENRDSSLLLLQSSFWKAMREHDVRTANNTLQVLADCPYIIVHDVGRCMISSALIQSDINIKSMGIRVIGHWCHPDLVEFLDSLDLHNQPWLMVKCNAVKQDILKKWNLQER